MLNPRLSALIAAVFLLAGGCGGSSGKKDGGTGGVDGSIPGQGGTNFTCGVEGDTCATGTDCCTNLCDTVTKKCLPGITSCSGEGSSCKLATDCCNLKCDTATLKCKSGSCIADNEACTNSADCCGQSCEGGVCKPLNNACLTAGNPCEVTANADGSNNNCCSGLCAGGKCVLGSSFCIQPGDACSRDTDCCGGWCVKGSGATLGTCQDVATSGTGGCTHDGVLCDGCGDCCSRNCGPWALTGVNVCQPGLGCKILNSLCTKNEECCGYDINVVCAPATGPTGITIGVCSQNTGNQVPGGICGGVQGVQVPVNTCGNAEHDCICDVNPKYMCCHLDTLGLPRCMGSGTCSDGSTGVFVGSDPNCCIKAGDQCHMSSECCDLAPCVPDANGVLRCLPPTNDGGPTCVPKDGRCTATGDCCTGLVCNTTVGQEFGGGICGPPTVTPPADGGTPSDAAVPVCALYGQACSDTIKCCNGVQCTYSPTNSPCAAGQKGCTCYNVNPIP